MTEDAVFSSHPNGSGMSDHEWNGPLAMEQQGDDRPFPESLHSGLNYTLPGSESTAAATWTVNASPPDERYIAIQPTSAHPGMIEVKNGFYKTWLKRKSDKAAAAGVAPLMATIKCNGVQATVSLEILRKYSQPLYYLVLRKDILTEIEVTLPNCDATATKCLVDLLNHGEVLVPAGHFPMFADGCKILALDKIVSEAMMKRFLDFERGPAAISVFSYDKAGISVAVSHLLTPVYDVPHQQPESWAGFSQQQQHQQQASAYPPQQPNRYYQQQPAATGPLESSALPHSHCSAQLLERTTSNQHQQGARRKRVFSAPAAVPDVATTIAESSLAPAQPTAAKRQASHSTLHAPAEQSASYYRCHLKYILGKPHALSKSVPKVGFTRYTYTFDAPTSADAISENGQQQSANSGTSVVTMVSNMLPMPGEPDGSSQHDWDDLTPENSARALEIHPTYIKSISYVTPDDVQDDEHESQLVDVYIELGRCEVDSSDAGRTAQGNSAGLEVSSAAAGSRRAVSTEPKARASGDQSMEVTKTSDDQSTETTNTSGDQSTEVTETSGDQSTEMTKTSGDQSTEVTETSGDQSTVIHQQQQRQSQQLSSAPSVASAAPQQGAALGPHPAASAGPVLVATRNERLPEEQRPGRPSQALMGGRASGATVHPRRSVVGRRVKVQRQKQPQQKQTLCFRPGGPLPDGILTNKEMRKIEPLIWSGYFRNPSGRRQQDVATQLRYFCENCGVSFASLREAQDHLDQTAGRSALSCMFCELNHMDDEAAVWNHFYQEHHHLQGRPLPSGDPSSPMEDEEGSQQD